MKMILERRALIIIGIIVLVGFGTFMAYWYFRAPVIQTKEFSGILQSIADNSIFNKEED